METGCTINDFKIGMRVEAWPFDERGSRITGIIIRITEDACGLHILRDDGNSGSGIMAPDRRIGRTHSFVQTAWITRPGEARPLDESPVARAAREAEHILYLKDLKEAEELL